VSGKQAAWLRVRFRYRIGNISRSKTIGNISFPYIPANLVCEWCILVFFKLFQMATFKHALALQLLFSAIYVPAQKIPLIGSGDVIKEATTFYDSGRYEDAIALYKTIPARDTNYVHMLSELAMTYDANKNYDEAIAACREALKQPDAYKAHILRTLGSALDHKGEYEQAVSVFENAIREFPYNFSLHYNLGVTHYNNEQYDKAIECFFNTLSINPYHPGSHLNLGRLSAFQGKKVRAMMSLGMYLSIASTDNPRLVFLERFLNNEIAEEGTFPFEGTTPFDKIDQIIRAKVVTDKNFKPLVTVDAILVKQYQLFLDQISLIGNDPDDQWLEFYLPIYAAIGERNLLEPFLYHILSSTAIADVAKWKKKNERKLNEFYALANNGLAQHRLVTTLPPESGMPGPVSCWYNEDNQLVEIGNKGAGDTRIGKWRFYETNSVLIAEGSYDEQGNKVGIWNYYHNNGKVRSTENNSTGEISRYNRHGEPLHRYFLNDGEIDGAVEIFYPCGQIKEKLVYAAGKRSGPGSTYFSNGGPESNYRYKEDELDGEYIEYHPDGQLKSRNFYREGLRDGPFEEYYGNGRLQSRGSYEAGKATGRWEYFHMTGKPERNGTYKEGKGSGTWSYYDLHGNPIEERTFDEEGEIHGEDIIYSNGRVDYIHYYDHGQLTGMTYFDNAGEEISKSGHPSCTFDTRGYYPDGKLRFEGSYREGKAHGTWKYYFHEGNPEKQYTQVNGLTHGEFVEYFRSGGVKYRQHFKEGTVHGYAAEYYVDGTVKEEGWYQNGQREQQWLGWYKDGSMESDYYYRNGKLDGECIDFTIDGKRFSSYTYRNGRVVSIVYYNEDQGARVSESLAGRLDKVEQTYANGKEHTRMTLSCGLFTDEVKKFYPDGKVYSVQEVRNGYLHGRFERYYPDGKQEGEGQYIHGSKYGPWVWYHVNGNKSSEGKYVSGEQDSIWTYYFLDGTPSSRAHYLNGERHGLMQLFGQEGKVILEKRFIEGDLMDYRLITRDGTLGSWTIAEPDQTLVVKYPNGNKAYEESRKNGLLHGPNRHYYPDGQLYYEYNYRHGDETGDYRVFFPGGKLHEKGTFVNGEYDGIVEHFHQSGTRHFINTYRMGIKHGKFAVFENNRPAKELMFWAGVIMN
jgi:antitoxin component YwqK of YwqJK toxin-antitoxin module/Tfp pilus assembly protein PilF